MKTVGKNLINYAAFDPIGRFVIGIVYGELPAPRLVAEHAFAHFAAAEIIFAYFEIVKIESDTVESKRERKTFFGFLHRENNALFAVTAKTHITVFGGEAAFFAIDFINSECDFVSTRKRARDAFACRVERIIGINHALLLRRNVI